MEPQAALVGTDGGAELDAVAAVDMDRALVIDPGHPEADHALRLHEGLNDALLFILRMLFHDEVQALQDLQHGLMEFLLIRVPGDDLGIYPLQILALQHDSYAPFSFFWCLAH